MEPYTIENEGFPIVDLCCQMKKLVLKDPNAESFSNDF